MNYYDELLGKLDELMNNKNYKEAEKLIDDELSMAYVPKDIETRLKEYKGEVKVYTFRSSSLTDEQIEEFLYQDGEHQLRAVTELDKRNLRDLINLCEDYLMSDGFINAKVLLIDSLIRQQINHRFIYLNGKDRYEFNPADVTKADEAEGYISALKCLEEYYLKEPSKLLLAQQLLNKEALLALPFNLSHEDGLKIAEKIENYIDEAFRAGE